MAGQLEDRQSRTAQLKDGKGGWRQGMQRFRRVAASAPARCCMGASSSRHPDLSRLGQPQGPFAISDFGGFTDL